LITISALDTLSEDLERVELKMRRSLETPDKCLSDVLAYILEGGGKRLRPALALLAAKFGQVDMEKATSLAGATELLHTATLVHDDLIDNSLLRRGQTTLNARWSGGATVLAGDLLFAQAAVLVAETDNVRIISKFAQTLGIICRGELSQLFAPSWREQTKEDYYDRIYSKTASLIAMAAESGGILAGLPEDQVKSLRRYGRDLGTAFQIVDDVLDFVGDEEQLGKPVGSDLRQGTITLPAMYFAWQNPDDQLLHRVLDHQEQNDEAIASVVSRIAQSDAIQTTLDEAQDFVCKGKEALKNLPDHPSKEAMLALANYVVERRV
jgi:geranylgeranyl pyrophosphate synthase